MSQTADIGAFTDASGDAFADGYNANWQALMSDHSGATAPPLTWPGMVWYDTATSLLKKRNPGNSAWVTIASWNGSAMIPYRSGVALTTTAVRLDNYAASAAPTVNDDSGDGYSAGSLWLWPGGGRCFRCRSASVGAAVWDEAGWPQPTTTERTNKRLLAADGTYLRAPEIMIDSSAQSLTDARIAAATLTRIVINNGYMVSANTAPKLRLQLSGAEQSGASDYAWRNNCNGTEATDASAAEINLTAANVSNGSDKPFSGEIKIYQQSLAVLLTWHLAYMNHSSVLSYAIGAARANFNGPVNGWNFTSLNIAGGSFRTIVRGDFA
jgi:hypothetical protein